MKAVQSYRDWWRPLPIWLKIATTLIAYPAWAIGVYCVATGNEKSTAAFSSFIAFAVVTVLHIVLDRRNSRSASEPHVEVDLGGVE